MSKLKKEKVKQKHSTASNVWFAFKWHFKITPVVTIYNILRVVFDNVITLLEHTFFVAFLVDSIENQRPLREILYFLIPLEILVAIKVISGPVVNAFPMPWYYTKFKKAVNLTLYKKATQMEISKYDNSEFYNDFVFAMQQAPEHMRQVVRVIGDMVSYLVISAITGAFIITAEPLTIIVAIVVVPVSFFASRIVNKLWMKMNEEQMPISRKLQYANRVFYIIDFIKDMKTGKMTKKIEKDFYDSTQELKVPNKKYAKKIIPLNVLANTISLIMSDGILLSYLFYQAIVKKKFGLGVLIALNKSANNLSNQIRQFTRSFPELQKHALYIEKMRVFLETENEMKDEGTADLPSLSNIELKNVSFTYPGNESPTLNNVSLKINKGEKIALVGFNGAGKSTLIKLMLRLYDVTDGEIIYGDRCIKDYPIADYRDRFGVLFQDFEIIASDIAHNITMDNTEFDECRADEAMKKVGFYEKIKSLPNGYKTQLTKEFDDGGVNLSGGEAQKIALARVLYSNSDIVVLDEPSSALDPIAEYQFNKAVTELAGNKTVIIISHRLSTTRFVDKIYMLENGSIIESGNHDDMIRSGGKYAEMFELQAEKYRN